MLVAGFPAGPWQTNCWVLAPGKGQEAVVIDPGMNSIEGIAELVEEHHLRPVAVILTHGHLDHMWSVTPVADGYGIPAWIHPEDRHLLTDPLAAMSQETRERFGHLVGKLPEPSQVREMVDGSLLEIAGMSFTARHAPGHTRGSTAFELPTAADPLLLTGDLLFAGAIGRTDLPGGDPRAMNESLRRVVLAAPEQTVVLPGHGPTSTIARELQSNPYLREELLGGGPIRADAQGEERR
ncbi:MAG: MBL fold metallo-hydrolase [Candidatus Nanopelagicales bacterium]